MTSRSQWFANLFTLPRAARYSLRDWRSGRASAAFSMAALRPLVGDRYLPWTVYSVNPDLARQVCNEVVINRRFEIYEFGSGLMTWLLVALARNLDLPLRITSVEQDADWLKNVESMIGDPAPAALELIHAPLSAYPLESPSREPVTWYELSQLASFDEPIQLAIVDGPAKDGWARWPALPWLVDRLAPDCAVVLDDVHMADIRRIGQDWTKRFGDAFEVEHQPLAQWFRRGDHWAVD